MVATYKIQSRIKCTEFKRVYMIVDAILPQLINAMCDKNMDFEINSISNHRDSLTISVHYDEADMPELCELFTLITRGISEEFEVIAMKGVL